MSSRSARRGGTVRIQVIVARGPSRGELVQATAQVGEHYVDWRVRRCGKFPYGLMGTSGTKLEGIWWCRGWRAADGDALRAANALELEGPERIP